jgi:organic hydroperoxide reductase OsmC/OhrA
VFDEPPPLGHDHAPTAAAVLGAAVGNCMSASFAFCLRKARLEPEALTTKVTTRVARNEQGYLRVEAIDVEIAPDFKNGEQPRLERCSQLFEDFCTVTASIRRGIPVHVTLRRPTGTAT